ncbi:MAG: hypothetical protein NT128_01510 [Proteobacteria bacterium]|nr:hypothetical protein [Pseudomonadota bacterium]
MGPMLLLVLGILSAVGLALYQFGEHHRFDMVSDAKGGIFIIDRKSAAINYCNDKTCSLVGNGALPSQIMGNPAALMAVQGAIMGAPAAVTVVKPGEAPKGMQSDIAASSAKPANNTPAVATSGAPAAKPAAKSDDKEDEDDDDDKDDDDKDSDDDDKDEGDKEEDKKADAPDGFSFK